MKRPALIAVLVSIIVLPTLAKAEMVEKLVDAAKAFAYLDKYYSIAPKDRSLFLLRYNFRQDGKAPTDLKLTLVDGAKRTPIMLAPDGKVERLPTAAELAAKVQVAIEVSKGAKIGEQLNMDTTIKPAAEIDPGQCAAAIAQTNAAIARFAGLLAFAAPHIKGCSFPGAPSGVAVMPDGKTTLLPLVKGQPVYDPAAITGAKLIRLAKAPAVVSLE